MPHCFRTVYSCQICNSCAIPHSTSKNPVIVAARYETVANCHIDFHRQWKGALVLGVDLLEVDGALLWQITDQLGWNLIIEHPSHAHPALMLAELQLDVKDCPRHHAKHERCILIPVGPGWYQSHRVTVNL